MKQTTQFGPILSQSRSVWNLKNFSRGLCPLEAPLGSSEHPSDPPAPLGLASLVNFPTNILLIFFFPNSEGCIHANLWVKIKEELNHVESTGMIRKFETIEWINLMVEVENQTRDLRISLDPKD